MDVPIFLWPKPQPLTAIDLFGAAPDAADVEQQVRALYPGAEPVLFSSARAGLTAVLDAMGLGRSHAVWCPAFSSHCVLEAVARLATPTPLALAGSSDPPAAALIYHQWGLAHTSHWPASVRIIEDAVDSLLLPGRDPFIAGGDFLLWSLPKVLATLAGGVVFCRRAQDAAKLRGIRATRPTSILQAWLRWRAKSNASAARYWNGAEAEQGGLPAVMLRQVRRRLADLERLVDERRAFLRGLSVSVLAGLEAGGRLPSNLPMSVPQHWQSVWHPERMFNAGLRNFNTDRSAPNGQWAKVAPLPVHAEVGPTTVRAMLDLLNLKGFGSEFDFV